MIGKARKETKMNKQTRLELKNATALATVLGGLLAIAPAQALAEAETAAKVTVQVDKPGHKVASTLWGIFFEDINCSADGGVYAELIRNRSLEDTDKPDHWTLVTAGSGKGSIGVSLEKPMGKNLVTERNRRSLCLKVEQADADAPVGVANDGFWGIALKEGAQYKLSLNARGGDGFGGPLVVSLESKDGKVYAKETIKTVGEDWKKFQFTLTSSGTDPKARLVVRASQKGAVWLDMVSLFPKDTWKNHGLRTDLMNMLDGLKPSFVRFPGGCWVEGDTMKFAYRWKDTVGDVATRRTHYNIWQYYATHGLGFHEYLQMCEDLRAEPLFVINCGMSHKENVPMDQMGPYIQDALDAIEYCNGPADSRYGAMRAKSGHPAPFNLQFLEIGNENGGPAYHERYALFNDAIKARYPEMQLIANDWSGVPKNRPLDIIDEHYYSTPEFFMQQSDRYDKYDRKGPKIYVGEYAVTQGCGQGNLRAAIGEAAFMTGMERNSDVVTLASYAPLFANVNYKKWNPDLICYDSARSYGLPSYYVQQLFSQHRGDSVLPIDVQTPSSINTEAMHGKVGVGTWLTQAEYKDIKVTRGNDTLFSCDFAEGTKGWQLLGGAWKAQDGVLRQSGKDENIRALAGDASWSDYTYSLKARKTGGDEGFLVLFNAQNENEKSWWNLGGWGNTKHGLELAGIGMAGSQVNGKIETGRWYDIRIELKGANIKCYLDDKLVHDINYPSVKRFFASATTEQSSGDIIVKVVNGAPEARPAEIALNGAVKIEGPAKAYVLTSAKGEDENTLEEPTKVAPRTESFNLDGNKLQHQFPGNSLTVMRIKTR